MNACYEKFINIHSVASKLSFVTSLMEWFQKMMKTSLQNGESGYTFKYDKQKGGCNNQTFSWRQKQNKHQGNEAGIQSTQLIEVMLDESVQILYQGIHMNQEKNS